MADKIRQHGITVDKYGARNWGVYVGAELICVTVYKKGAMRVMRELATAYLGS